MTDQPNPIRDLTADSDAVERLFTDRVPARWLTPTPAEGWTVAHQVAHLS